MSVAGQGQVPVGNLLGKQPKPPSRWRALARWRDWSLAVKLAAVILVPLLIALVLGALAIANQSDRSSASERTDRMVGLAGEVRTLADGLSAERAQTANMLTSGAGGQSPKLAAARSAVDGAIPAVVGSGTDELGPVVAAAAERAAAELSAVPAIRDRVSAGQIDAPTAITEYSAATSALLGLDAALAAQINAVEIGGSPAAMHALLVAEDNLAIEQALVSYGIDRGALTPSERGQLRAAELRFTDAITEFDAVATQAQRQAFDATVAGPAYDTRTQLVSSLLAGAGAQGLAELAPQQWRDSSAAVLGGLDELLNNLGEQVAATSEELVSDASAGAGVLAVLLFVAFVLAAAIVFVIARQLLRSLRVLRTSALDIAEEKLPAVVRSIQQGQTPGDDVAPVPVPTSDEVGEVARAFDAVHRQAVRLAGDQASTRTAYGNVFVNLSRRSQSLVQRQLQLIERLERDEEDADQLATLFQLDHLATRMRRNNENLLVLSGSESGRRSGQPVTVTDVLRAAVSEIEQYQRVVVQTPPDGRVVGYAASDLMRLIAELLDNATAFSAPQTEVTIASRLLDDGALSIDILDKGIGMNESEVAEANGRMAEAASMELATSRRMGLFVVGRLASRHGFGVALYGGKDIVGVRATVHVPATLMLGAGGGAGTRPAPHPRQSTMPQRNAQAGRSMQQPGDPLPVRNRAANGAPKPEALPGFADIPKQGGEPAPTGNEVSGTALFTPIGKDEPRQEASTGTETGEGAAPVVEPADAEVPQEGGPDPQAMQRPEEAAPETDASPGKEAPETEAQRAPRPDQEAGAADPAAADELPGGKELFTANGTAVSDWWRAAATASEAARANTASTASGRTPTGETTPIFDAMVSAWFRSSTPTGKPTGSSSEQAGTPAASGQSKKQADWDFAADESFRTVQAVSRSEPSSYTQVGLPRRKRGEQLLPGSAGSAAEQGQPAKQEQRELPVRDPADVRGRLSSFQHGVHRGRQDSAAPSDTGGAPAAGQRAESRDRAAGAAGAAAPAAVPEQPTVGTNGRAGGSAQASEPSSGDDAEAWNFAADEGARAAQAVSGANPSGYTAAGLPRRRRGEKLVPGSAGGSAPTRSPTERDPADVRGRLSSFQSGIRKGRHQTSQSNGDSHVTQEGE